MGRDLNKKGIYFPEQIEDTVQENWDKVNPHDLEYVSKEKVKQIVL